MAIGPAKMPLLDHLSELRCRIVRILVTLVVFIVLFYTAAPIIGNFLIWPIADILTRGDNTAQLFAFSPFEAFSTRFKIAFWTSIIAASPMIFWQILAFFLPALKPKERKWFIPTFFTAICLFIIGMTFSYTVIIRATFDWLIEQSEGLGDVIPQMSSYIDMIIKFEIGFGIAFQLPLVVFYLVVFGIIPYKKIRAAWRVIYLILMVFSAMITPDASPITMLLLFGALVVLYELSLAFSRVVLASKIKKEKAINNS